MKVLIRIALACGVVAGVAALAGVNHASARAQLACGANYVGTAKYTKYCGPAKAKLTVGGKTYNAKSKYAYVRLDSQKNSPGASKHAGYTWQLPNGKTGYGSNGKVTLTSGLKSGSFSGKGITGTFHC